MPGFEPLELGLSPQEKWALLKRSFNLPRQQSDFDQVLQTMQKLARCCHAYDSSPIHHWHRYFPKQTTYLNIQMHSILKPTRALFHQIRQSNGMINLI